MRVTIGNNLEYWNHGPVSIPLNRHGFVLAMTGAGKTTILKHIFAEYIERGLGVIVIDPNATFADWCAANIPKARVKEVRWIDPAADTKVGLNPFQYWTEQELYEFIDILTRIYGEQSLMGRAAWILRNIGKAVRAAHKTNYSPWNIHLALASKKYREWVFSFLPEHERISFFEAWEEMSQKTQDDAIISPLNKTDALLGTENLRLTLGQTEGIDFAQAMDESQIIIIRGSEDLSEDELALIGSVALHKVYFSAARRKNNRDFAVIVDEAHRMNRGNKLDKILSELRKRNVWWFGGNQTLDQLPEGSVSSILGNVATKIGGKMSADDAARFCRDLGRPLQEPQTLVNLNPFEFYLKTEVNGRTTDALHILANDAPRIPNPSRPSKVVRTSQQRFGNTKEEIEKCLNRLIRP